MLSERELNDVRVIIEDMQIRNDPNWIFIDQLLQDFLRLRDALRPFADAWYSNVMEDDDPNTRIVTAYEWGTAHLNIAGGDYLEARHLRAAHLALNPDDTGGEDE